MNWALLFIALASVLGGSGESVYFLPKIDKYVKKYVVDEERKNTLLVLIKDDIKSQNCLNALSQFQSLLKTKFEDRMALFTDENSIFFQYYVSETEAIEMHVNARLDLEQLLLAHAHLHAVIVENTTEGEWKIIRRKL